MDADTAARPWSGSTATSSSTLSAPLVGLKGSRRTAEVAAHWRPLRASTTTKRRRPRSPTSSPPFSVSLPLRAGLTGSGARGAPDLVVRLLDVRVGADVEEAGGGAAAAAASTSATFASTAVGLLALRLAADSAGGPAAFRALAGVGAARAALPRRTRAALRARVVGTAGPALEAAWDCLDRVAPPAFTLAAAGAVLALVHPPSAALLRAVGAAIPVAAGYSSTARQVALGRLGPRGAGRVEAAWRARHRWAALRVAPHLGDMPEAAPLGGVVTAWEGSGGGVSCGGGGGGWAAGGGGSASRLWLSFPLPGGPRPAARAAPAKSGGGAASPPPALPAWQDDDDEADVAADDDDETASLASSSPSSLDLFIAKPPPGLALYGRADHAGGEEAAAAAAAQLDPATLFLRALVLLLVFAPFALLAPVLLASSSAARAARLPPAVAARPTAAAWALLLAGIRAAGPAFIKWGQWAAVRGDLFPPGLAAALGGLHDAAPAHGWAATRAALEDAYGGAAGVDATFAGVDQRPLASGSVAQVHRALLRVRKDGRPSVLPVALKVRHPGVADRLAADFALLKPVAAWAEAHVPGLRGLPLSASLAQFTHTMTAQADLRVEAAHLVRFAADLGARGRGPVTTPQPVAGLDPTADVLAESFEAGTTVAAFMKAGGRSPSPAVDTRWNPQIVALGVAAYLHMLHACFMHVDLHPGNIVVRALPAGSEKKGGLSDEGEIPRLQIVLLDLGLAEELTPAVRRTLVSLLAAVGKGDGDAAARHVLAMSAAQTCPDPAGFRAAMARLFARAADIRSPTGVDLDAVLKGVLAAARTHAVAIDSRYASLLVGVCVLAAFGSALGEAGVMDAAAPALFLYGLTGRMGGRLCV